MAIPAVLLYFVSIGLVYVFQRKEALEADIAKEREEKLEKEKQELQKAKEEAEEAEARRRRKARAK
jgi:Sec-independent protein secretion pathway component TatC